MRLLVVTQVVDTESRTLSFFHEWIRELAARFERVAVVCLYEGMHTLPNVSIHSLGKEKGTRSRVAYAISFLSYTWKTRREYDAVFVHMNEEYLFIGGWLWKLLGKRVYLWRNHYAGSWKTRIAGFFADRVFYTSKHSYTASFPRSVRMPVGVDTRHFAGDGVERVNRSILFFGRFSPSKRPVLLLDALQELTARNCTYRASFYGSAEAKDEAYRNQAIEKAKELGLPVTFHEGVPHAEAPPVFRAHDIYVNLGNSGMYDKMLFEAAAAGCMVLARSDDWHSFMGDAYWIPDDTAQGIADAIEATMAQDRDALRAHLQERAAEHALPVLMDALQCGMQL